MAFYFGVFKEPRGLIRFLQFVFAICAFATACNGGSSIRITLTTSNATASASWSYPYNLKDTPLKFDFNNSSNSSSLAASNNIKPSAEFFVFIGVTSMLLCLAFLIIYIVLDRQYRNNEIIPLVDFIISAIWTIFWFAGSAAWAQGVSNIRSSTNAKNIVSLLGYSNDPNQYTETDSPNYANVIVSVIFGFLNFLLWLGSIWFVYKETRFFKSRNTQSNNFSNIGSPTVPNQPQPRPPRTLG